MRTEVAPLEQEVLSRWSGYKAGQRLDIDAGAGVSVRVLALELARDGCEFGVRLVQSQAVAQQADSPEVVAGADARFLGSKNKGKPHGGSRRHLDVVGCYAGDGVLLSVDTDGATHDVGVRSEAGGPEIAA